MADPVYATAFDMWQMALPPDTLFQDQGIEPGTWTSVSKVGTGTGSMDVSLLSNPRSSFNVIAKTVRAGELNLYGVLNPGPFPQFILSLDNGVSYSHPLEAKDDGSLAFQKGGFTLLFQSGIAPPSFELNDTFTFSTTASPDILVALDVASRKMDCYFRDTYCLPFVSWGVDVKKICCEIARWELIERRGLDKGQDFDVYRPEYAMKWLDMVATGKIQPSVVENGSGFVFPQWTSVRRPYRTDWRF